MTPADRLVDLEDAKSRRAEKTERVKAAARRAYEAGEMGNKEISRAVGCCEKTLKRWIAAEGWRKG